MVSIGVIGETPENGHPFSFSGILNGFNLSAIRKAGWGLIADYLSETSPDSIGNLDAKVTHVWFPDPDRAALLSLAAYVPHVAGSITQLIREVDAVMILRDDWEHNFETALKSLEAGKPTFVDKPLSLRRHQLDTLMPFLAQGQLMSASGFRFAPELANFTGLLFGANQTPSRLFLAASGPSSWGHSALHLLEPGLVIAEAIGIPFLGERFEPPKRMNESDDHEVSRFFSHLKPESVFGINPEEALMFLSPKWSFGINLRGTVLGNSFKLECFAEDGRNVKFDLANRVGAFRGLLAAFISMVANGVPPVPPAETLWALNRTIEGQDLLYSTTS